MKAGQTCLGLVNRGFFGCRQSAKRADRSAYQGGEHKHQADAENTSHSSQISVTRDIGFRDDFFHNHIDHGSGRAKDRATGKSPAAIPAGQRAGTGAQRSRNPGKHAVKTGFAR